MYATLSRDKVARENCRCDIGLILGYDANASSNTHYLVDDDTVDRDQLSSGWNKC